MTSSAPHSDFSTPSSERTVYFDAPIMHIFSKNESDDAGFISPTAKDSQRRTSLMYDYTNGTVKSRASTTDDAQYSRSIGEDNIHASDYANGQQVRQPQESASNSTAEPSDSGYSSSSPRNQPRSVSGGGLKPIPVVWSDDGATGERDTPRPASTIRRRVLDRPNMGEPRRSQSMRSFRANTVGQDDQESVRTTPSGRRTPRGYPIMSGGGFANGAGTIGPNAAPSEEETGVFRSRSVNADMGLSKKQKLRIGKNEVKEGKRLVKVMKEEAKAERKAVEISVKELAEIQRIQKNSIKEEAKTNASYAQALRVFHKEELVYLAARTKYERAQADLQAYEDSREAARDHAREATEMLQEKNREVEWLRAQKAADDREREAKIRELSGKAR